jgi:glycine/D-amino acid oxidase-like deaminating enzyme
MGLSVTLIDQYGAGNARASSGGETRQIRAGYGDREIYTRWCLEAFGRWEARQKEWGKTLFFRTGQISLAHDWSRDLTETRRMFDKLKVPYEVVPPDQVRKRYPQIAAEDGQFGFFTPTTGVLKAREGCLAVAHAFERKGGKFVIARTALGKQSGGKLDDVVLSTGQTIPAPSFVFALGPWLPKLFPQVLAGKLRVPRRVVFFYGTPPGDERFTHPNFPAWSAGGAYGFPCIEGKGFKVAPTFDDLEVDPDAQERILTADEVRRGREFVSKWFPGLKNQPLVDSRVCQYENSVDAHFICQRHPELGNVWLVGGGSGHGYKHGIMFGAYVANRVVGKDANPELEEIFRIKP